MTECGTSEKLVLQTFCQQGERRENDWIPERKIESWIRGGGDGRVNRPVRYNRSTERDTLLDEGWRFSLVPKGI